MKTIAILLCLAFTASAAVLYDESTSGDLSGDLANPDAFIATVGSHQIIGTVGANGNTGATDGSDADYFYFEVGPGIAITELVIDNFADSPGGAGRSFMGYREGSAFLAQDGSDLDGFTLFFGTSGNVLPELSSAALSTGNHAFWVQETSNNTVDYTLRFTVIPEPNVVIYLLLGLALPLTRRRSRPRMG